MRLPDFLIIGAMKCGTTSLYFDLDAHPGVFMPEDKEPHSLADNKVLSRRGHAAYSRLFRRAGAEQICGEASTGYSKLPDVPGVPERALSVVGPKLKVIYLVREPVSRVVSHHYHEYAAGTMGGSIDDAVTEHPCLIDYSSYAMQVHPWIALFGAEQVRIVRFESYVEDRVSTVESLYRFLGVDPRCIALDPDAVFNPSDSMLAPRGPWWRLSRGPLYQTLVRPLLSRPIRQRMRRALQRPAPARPAGPSLATVQRIIDAVRDDVDRLQELLGTPDPPWDLDAVYRRYQHRRRPPGPAGAGADGAQRHSVMANPTDRSSR